jgi:hypothetical protein
MLLTEDKPFRVHAAIIREHPAVIAGAFAALPLAARLFLTIVCGRGRRGRVVVFLARARVYKEVPAVFKRTERMRTHFAAFLLALDQHATRPRGSAQLAA